MNSRQFGSAEERSSSPGQGQQDGNTQTESEGQSNLQLGMAGSPFAMNPFHEVTAIDESAVGATPDETEARARVCPFGSHCSCIFAGSSSTVALLPLADINGHDKALVTEVDNWTKRGWIVTTASHRRVVLERRLALPFCVNAALCVVTGLLWLIYWIPRSRHPKVLTMVLTLSANGEVFTTRL
jgi:hypothetical protein